MTIQQKFDLTGRVAVVTGGVGLLGAEFCRTLAEAGTAVAVVDLNASASATTADTLAKSGYNALAIPTDIHPRPESVNAMVDKVLSTFGRLDILVNSAALDPKFAPDAVKKGITPGAFEDYPLEQWNSSLNVNLTGMLLVTQACVKPMIAQGKKGSIINISQSWGVVDGLLCETDNWPVRHSLSRRQAVAFQDPGGAVRHVPVVLDKAEAPDRGRPERHRPGIFQPGGKPPAVGQGTAKPDDRHVGGSQTVPLVHSRPEAMNS